ncbi:ATP-binding protein [Cytophagales bacterium LB-30]|uniref:ATP-binding protein n=1 Tax=Shiella aurantiaca TaxID=3058365 RepID=A0ABT8F9V9_9BACT|nr:ATP-binding protein [Shiella aurantiaca]MDN4167039.1 ATP-binding protein [Shiella aurantiaca]
MILEIRLTNFYSIKDEVVLDLRAANIKTQKAKSLSDNTITFGDTEVLKTAAIYGANASGKSNIIKAIRFCCSMIFSSHLNNNENTIFNFKTFKFKGFDKKPSSFIIRFISKGIEYEYGFSLTIHEIVTEELFYYPKGRKVKVFTRDERLGKDKSEVYSFGSVIKKPLDVADNTSRKTLYISRASQMDREIGKEIFTFFNEKFILGYVGFNGLSVERLFQENKAQLLKALKIADSDIQEIKIRKEKVAGKNINADLATQKLTVKDIEQEHLLVTTFHKSNPEVPFDLHTEESDGTREMFFIMLTILDIIKHDKILLIDEIEQSLHNKIVEYIVSLFHASSKAQLIFTTHNTHLLNLERFRKDQVFFVNKKPDGSSDLYSLFDYKDFRDTMDLEKAYLQGRFDAIPYINSSISNLKELMHETK